MNATNSSLPGLAASTRRVTADGKGFRLGAQKFHVKGVTYGPFAPNADGEMFASREQTRRDFEQIRVLGANVLRVYYVPPRWLLDLADEYELKVLIDIPWSKHLCFLDSAETRRAARQAVREAVQATRGHPAVFAYSVVNEVSAEITRWSGVGRVERFIDELVDEARQADPDCLCTFTSFPPTEFLRPETIDFVCFNVYLHEPAAFEGYLARLQTLAGEKPLVLGEFGMDSIREGATRQGEFLRWQIELAFRNGLAGTVLFSFTDDWWRGGMQIEDWGFGLTTRDRRPKEAFTIVQQQYRAAPYFPLPRVPKVSVVVATYNGAHTLRTCLESLARLNYPDYEVIVVDDGSKDATPEIAKQFPAVRYLRQDNHGLSVARNTGIRAATGEVVAFTDDDCRADEGWLYYLVGDLLRGDYAGVGGHNFLPPDDSPVAAAVMASPGGPAHVMLTDREAEHIPGCNMAFYKWALEQIGGFDPIYRKAGDDVDVCWRLQDAHLKIGFSPAGFVWHYRRSTVKAYLKQQAGYGEAEALLIGRHPEHFNALGGGVWHGRIYSPAFAGLLLRQPVIYHGVFGSGFFQRLYTPDPFEPILLCTSLGYHVLITLPLMLLSAYFTVLWPVALASLGLSLGACIAAGIQARLPQARQRFWSRPLVALLFFLQPLVRGWARFKWRLNLRERARPALPETPRRTGDGLAVEPLAFWTNAHDAADRCQFLGQALERFTVAGWSADAVTGWTRHDLRVAAGPWTRLKLTTATEDLGHNERTLRCRLETAWSLPAWLIFLAAVALILLLLQFRMVTPWVWMSLLLLPLVNWAFEDARNDCREATVELLQAVAAGQRLVRLADRKRPV
jgi:glycosyltransferase involved in cell wall biosynthesis